MIADQTGIASQSLYTLFSAGSAVGQSDEELLQQFAASRRHASELAFVALVTRHGPMVRRVCRALLADPNDADDAFQATFFILARKARTIHRPDLLANWLYGTASRAARKLRQQTDRRRKHERRQAMMARIKNGSDADHVEAHALQREHVLAMHEEVARLSRPLRSAVLLCDLQGLAQDEAAARLRCSDRTLRRRLKTGHELLRVRLTRRGLAPTAGLLAEAWAGESVSASAAITESSARMIAQNSAQFAVGKVIAGSASTAATLAQGVIKVMVWAKLTGVAMASVAVAALGLGVASGLGSPRGHALAQRPGPSKEESRAVDDTLTPAEEYQALLKQYNDALNAYQKAAEGITEQGKIAELYGRLAPKLGDLAPRFVALAQRYLKDPIAVDALLWVVEQTMSAGDQWESDFSKAVWRAMEILARDHAGEPRLGPLCLKLITYESANRDRFLRAIAEQSPNHTVKGQAGMALAQYLGMKALHVEMIQHPDAPENVEKMRLLLSSIFGPDGVAGSNPPISEAPAMLRKEREDLARHAPDYLKHLLTADTTVLRRESEELYARVIAEFADVPYSRLDGRPTQQTLADVARRSRRPATTLGYNALEEAFRVAERAANDAAKAAGVGEAGVQAYLAKAPKWAGFGPKFWELVESDPRSPPALDSLLWILGHYYRFFDAGADRDATVSKAVDVLIRDHMTTIASDLASRNVANAFNHGSPMPGPHIDRLYRALYEHAASRETRGRMGLALARHIKAEADMAERLAAARSDLQCRVDLAVWPPSYIERMKRADISATRHEAELILEQVKAQYGDVRHLLGEVVQPETLSTVVDRELSDLRTLKVGQPSPQISGQDVEGKPMTLSEFRGKVVLLDFGSHEHCGGCRLVYPRLRELARQYLGRPFVILGINNNDRREVLNELHAKGEITWRCWWDGDRLDGPGPITTRWNIQGYPSFIILDHRGVIRHKDLHPEDAKSFGAAVEKLVKSAEGK